MSVSQTLDRIDVTFDDDNAVIDAGLILTGTLVRHLGLEDLVDETVSVGYRPGRKLLTLAHTMVAGGDCIDDAAMLRAGSTGRVLGHQVVASSTLGTWLRTFTFGHVRQLDRVAELALTRAWAAGSGPGDAELVMDVDSTIIKSYGYAKQGTSFGYTGVRGMHPLVATRADTGEVLHARMRKGSANTGRGAERFVRETVGRVRRAGATGPIVLRADAGFWSKKVITACRDHDVRFSITVRRTSAIRAAIDSIDEDAWIGIDYTEGGDAQVAERELNDGVRLIVRRTRIHGHQPALFDTWRHHAFVTDRHGDTIALDADHRAHAVVELAIRELKNGAGINHCPSGVFNANAAWLVAATLAHNLVRWTGLLGQLAPDQLIVTKTIRRRLLALPGRLTHTARRWTLHLPARWPWRHIFNAVLGRLRALPAIG